MESLTDEGNYIGDICIGIVEEVAEREDCDPTEIPPLNDVIDPDALCQLVRSGGSSVVFEYVGYEVQVNSANDIVVSETAGVEEIYDQIDQELEQG